MVDTLKEYVRAVNATTTAGVQTVINIASPAVSEQDLVKVLDFTVTNTSQAVTATLEYDNNILNTWSSGRGEQLGPIELSGSQLVDSSLSYDLKITPEKYYSSFTAVSFASIPTSTGTISSSVESATILPDLTAAEAHSTLDFSATTRDVILTQDSVLCTFKGAPSVATISSGKVRIFDLSESPVLIDTLGNADTTSYHGITTDGTYLYSVAAGSTNQLSRWSLSTGTQSTHTTSATVHGRSANTGGIIACHGGYVYTTNFDQTSMYKINTSTFVVSSFAIVQPSSTYVCGYAQVTTTEGTPRNLLVVSTAHRLKCIDLDTDTELYNNVTYAQTCASFSGNSGLEIAPGVFWARASTGNAALAVDFNNGVPVYSVDSASAVPTLGAAAAYHVIEEYNSTYDDVTYTTYANGVHINNA